ncbi:hypothetical protein, partial [Klebsiella pneumoniae]|uniref:hypothetical protein n=1 Tax=Klebsiella pneumoniae TaxID=573 RepID=UPI00210C1C57
GSGHKRTLRPDGTFSTASHFFLPAIHAAMPAVVCFADMHFRSSSEINSRKLYSPGKVAAML